MEKVEAYRHPRNQFEVVIGIRLRAGDTIQEDDVYDSTSGRWEKAPCPGLVLQEGCKTYWVRPEA